MVDLDPVHRALGEGRFADAEAMVAALTIAHPDSGAAWMLRAMLACQSRRYAEAESAALHAAGADPACAQTRYVLARARKGRGDLAGAAEACRAALALRPDYPEALVSLAIVQRSRGAGAEALALLERAVELRPDMAEAQHNLATLLAARGHAARAAAAFERSLGSGTQRPDAWIGLGEARLALAQWPDAVAAFDRALDADAALPAAHHGRGVALREQGRYAEAAEAFQRSCDLAPDHAQAWNNLGLAQHALGRDAPAETCYRHALALDADAVEPLVNLALLFEERGRFDTAEQLLRAGVERHPEDARVWNNLGVKLLALQRAREALQCFERATTLDPALHSGHLYAGIAHLQLGDYARGWALYESRWAAMPALQAARPVIDAPEWTGEALAGATIVVIAEQGLGDALQFVRYVPLLAARGARVALLTHAPLKRLFRSVAGVATVHAFGEALPPARWQIAMLSLPRLFGTTLATVPAGAAYLAADDACRVAWSRRLGAARGLRVGLAWAGDPRPADRRASAVDRRRSIPLTDCAALWSVPGIEWYSLQKGPASSQIAALPQPSPLADHTHALHDFDDTAALVLNLDLVISVDTSVAHLAGALGRPVWLLSRFDGCWRWLLDRDDSPWYPSLRIFRQSRPLDWGPVIERVAGALRIEAGRRGAPNHS
ncbi:MAG: tetratricopeptide repeat protein [Betaproteobacteria bacterium]